MKEIRTTKYLFFGADSEYSNSWISKFSIDGKIFMSSEQAFQYYKALTFGDSEIASLILAETNPSKARELGRRVSLYRDDEWLELRSKIMYSCVYSKFTQSELLKFKIIESGHLHFINTGMSEFIWSSGLSESEVVAGHITDWKGLNLLGKVLEDVREMIRLTFLLGSGIHLH